MTYRQLDPETRERRITELEGAIADLDRDLRAMRKARRRKRVGHLVERLLPYKLEYVVMFLIIATVAGLVWVTGKRVQERRRQRREVSPTFAPAR